MTTTPLDSDQRPDETAGQRPGKIADLVLLTGALAVAVFTFVISFVGLHDYGHRLMGLTPKLAVLVPLGVDAFSILGIIATVRLAAAPWRVRLYAWTVFLVPGALSVAGNLAHADVRSLTKAGTAGVAVAPVLLALAAHLVVVTLRHTRHQDSSAPAAESVSEQVSAPTEVDGDEETGQRRTAHNATPDSVKLAAVARLLAGADPAEVAASAGVSRKTVQRWTDQIATAARRPGQRPVSGPAAPDGEAPPASPWAEPPTAPTADDVARHLTDVLEGVNHNRAAARNGATVLTSGSTS